MTSLYMPKQDGQPAWREVAESDFKTDPAATEAIAMEFRKRLFSQKIMGGEGLKCVNCSWLHAARQVASKTGEETIQTTEPPPYCHLYNAAREPKIGEGQQVLIKLKQLTNDEARQQSMLQLGCVGEDTKDFWPRQLSKVGYDKRKARFHKMFPLSWKKLTDGDKKLLDKRMTSPEKKTQKVGEEEREAVRKEFRRVTKRMIPAEMVKIRLAKVNNVSYKHRKLIQKYRKVIKEYETYQNKAAKAKDGQRLQSTIGSYVNDLYMQLHHVSFIRPSNIIPDVSRLLKKFENDLKPYMEAVLVNTVHAFRVKRVKSIPDAVYWVLTKKKKGFLIPEGTRGTWKHHNKLHNRKDVFTVVFAGLGKVVILSRKEFSNKKKYVKSTTDIPTIIAVEVFQHNDENELLKQWSKIRPRVHKLISQNLAMTLPALLSQVEFVGDVVVLKKKMKPEELLAFMNALSWKLRNASDDAQVALRGESLDMEKKYAPIRDLPGMPRIPPWGLPIGPKDLVEWGPDENERLSSLPYEDLARKKADIAENIKYSDDFKKNLERIMGEIAAVRAKYINRMGANLGDEVRTKGGWKALKDMSAAEFKIRYPKDLKKYLGLYELIRPYLDKKKDRLEVFRRGYRISIAIPSKKKKKLKVHAIMRKKQLEAKLVKSGWVVSTERMPRPPTFELSVTRAPKKAIKPLPVSIKPTPSTKKKGKKRQKVK